MATQTTGTHSRSSRVADLASGGTSRWCQLQRAVSARVGIIPTILCSESIGWFANQSALQVR